MTPAPATAARTPEPPIGNPLDWFAAEHQRHRELCALMHELASSKVFQPAPLAALADFIRNDLDRHLAEEEQELFPLLRKRARPDDDVDQILGRLCAEHRGEMAHGGGLEAHIERCLDTQQAPGADPIAAAALSGFAVHELRHLALENAVVLPLARLRLTARDLNGLSRRLAARRDAGTQALSRLT
jgi:hemerythrin-like domain-containing protein